MTKELFEELYKIDVNAKTEKKNGLTYLSWAWAWAEFVKVCPDARYEIKMFDGKPYVYDENLGYMVFTSITIGDDTKEMWLPVMDGANRAMKAHPYKYYVKGKWNSDKKQYEMAERVCESATMFDINKTIMRCLTKNISMFGLGLYIYAGEDLPEGQEDEEPKPSNKSGIWDEPIEQKPKANQKSLKILADEFRKVLPPNEQDRILKGMNLERAEDIGTVDLEKYINFYKYGKGKTNESKGN